MEKNTILAIVLSSIVLITFSVIQGNRAQPVQEQETIVRPEQPVTPAPEAVTETEAKQETEIRPEVSVPAVSDEAAGTIEINEPETAEHITVRTNTITAVLTNEGGDMISWKLNEHLDFDENVDMIFRGNQDEAAAASRAFSIAFGGMEAQPVSNLFNVNRIADHTIEFYRDYMYPAANAASGNAVFRLTKRYDFKPNDYMFELTITLDGEKGVPDYNGNAYTLSFGPQIGPKFDRLDARNDFREYLTYTNGKRKKIKVNSIIDERPSWAAISGKYFIFIAIPHTVPQLKAVFTETPEPGIPSASRFSIIRPGMNQQSVIDTYRFYLGPKSPDVLNVYHTGENDFKYKDSSLVDAASSSGFWGPLVRLLKWLLVLFYKVAPNYGVAIILLTLFIKIIFFPLTKKSSEATLRMQELGPKIKEIQEKYKGNPQKLNAEMAQFYQREGYNPLSGCLPMLLQIPIFIGMYQLFNTHFDLRGASFIQGWIPDLSVPESIVQLPFNLPFMGDMIRGLPFIYVASQLLYGKFTQTPGQQSGTQMKMMMYVMPILFFFILYNVPSGLLVYWIFSNIFTLVQQVIINKYRHAKQATAAPEDQKTVIAPGKKKKKSNF